MFDIIEIEKSFFNHVSGMLALIQECDRAPLVERALGAGEELFLSWLEQDIICELNYIGGEPRFGELF